VPRALFPGESYALSTEHDGAEARASRTGFRGSIGRSRGAGTRGPDAMEPGREPAEVQAYRKLLTASTEHFNILRSAPAFSHDEHWDTQYQKVRMHTRDDTNARARVHRDGLGRTRPAPPLLPSRVRVSRSCGKARGAFRAGFFK